MAVADTTDAVWFAAGSSRRVAATVRVGNGNIYVHGENGDVRYEVLSNVQVSSRLADVPRRLQLPDGSVLVVADNAFIDNAVGGAQRRDRWIHFMESHWRMLGLLLAAAVMVLYMIYVYWLPRAAHYVAEHIPAEYVQEISTTVYNNLLKEGLLLPTHLAAEEEQRVESLFDAVAVNYRGQVQDLQLRLHRFDFFAFDLDEAEHEHEGGNEDENEGEKNEGRTGTTPEFGVANAFALPNGLIIVTDELVRLLTDDEITAVLAHEVGHVYHRHSMRALVQVAGIGAMVFFLFGDFTGLSAVPIVLAQLEYSRDFEREADCFAYDYIRAHGLSPLLIGTALTKLEGQSLFAPRQDEEKTATEQQEESASTSATSAAQENVWRTVMETLSTHPSTDSRHQLAQQCGQ